MEPQESGTGMEEGGSSHLCGTEINHLPDECLTEIFRRLSTEPLPDLHRTMPVRDSTVEHPLQCALICKRWSGPSSAAVHSLSLDIGQLIRTGTNPVTLGRRLCNVTALTLLFAALPIPCLSALPRRRSSSAVPPAVIDPFAGLEHLATRLETLDVLFPFGTHSGKSFASLLGAAAPNLRHLTASVVDPTNHKPRGSSADGGRKTRSEGGFSWLEAVCALPCLISLVLEYRGERLKEVCTRLGDASTATALQDLHLTRNEVPDAVTSGRLRSFLRSLDCAPGSIEEADKVGDLTALKTLILRDSWALQSLPESVGRLANLTRLHLSKLGKLTTLPDTVGQLSSLEVLSLSSCYSFQAFPDTFGNLRRLRELSLGWYRVLPPSLALLPSLHVLRIGVGKKDSIWKLPNWIGNLAPLKLLEIRGFESMSLPDTIGELASLQVCRMELKWVRTLPCSLGGWQSLRKLELKCTWINELPDSLFTLQNLQDLRLILCEQLYFLPEAISGLCSLVRLYVHACPTMFILPESLGELSSLVCLSLEHCWFLWSLPESVTKLTSLEDLRVLDCSNCQALPEGVLRLPRLKKLCCPSWLLPPDGATCAAWTCCDGKSISQEGAKSLDDDLPYMDEVPDSYYMDEDHD